MAGKPARGMKVAASAKADKLRVCFGANLRQARLDAGLTQIDLELATGIQQAYVSQVENGAQNVTLGTMAILADAVGAEVIDLLKKRRGGL